MYEGRFAAIMERGAATTDAIGLLMAGITPGAAAERIDACPAH